MKIYVVHGKDRLLENLFPLCSQIVSTMSKIENSHLIATAIGAAIGVIGAAGIFIYNKIMESRQQTMTNSNFNTVNLRIAEIQAELEALKLQQSQQKKRRKVISRKHISSENTYTTTDNDTDVDAFSTAGTDIADDEFFDCSDSEDAAGDNETRTSEINRLDLILTAIDEQDEKQEESVKNTYYKLQTLIHSHPDNVDVIWRFAKACYNYSNCISDLNMEKTIVSEGMKACEKIITFKHADLHKWYAILIGVHGEFLPIAEKIKNGYRFKDHVMLALEMRPNDSALHHLLGRFKYEVSSLSWVQRRVAATLFSEPPSASYEDAINSFEEAEKYATKPHLENQLFLSKCYIKLKEYEKAVDWLMKICEPPASTDEDMRIKREASQLLCEYTKYV